MKLAKGSLSWLITSLIGCICCLVMYLFTSGFLKTLFLILLFLFILIFCFLLLFFRDPERTIPNQGIVAIADGKIRDVSFTSGKNQQLIVTISTFMNVHNVHVNRMPIDGTITSVVHHTGSHLPAFKKESERNERVNITVKTLYGIVTITLIAGTLARRIVPYIKRGDEIKKGERIGLIRLGSRVDVSFPIDFQENICIKKGDRVKAGVDCLATIND